LGLKKLILLANIRANRNTKFLLYLILGKRLSRLCRDLFHLIVIIYIVLLWLSFSSCRIYGGVYSSSFDHPISGSRPARAEYYRQSSQFENAITQYKLHVQDRLRDKTRPEDENPYFYYLLIGDVYLEMSDAAKAEEAYLVALEQEVELSYLIDRFSKLGFFFERLGDIEQAIEILNKYRHLDPLIFDSAVDRLHKKSVAEEYNTKSLPDSPI
jgi:tetratricopeptide (TPR) repeat protein